MDNFRASDHYWIVAGDETQVFSSAVNGYVLVSDTTYQSWLEQGNVPTRIASQNELDQVLLVQAPQLVPALVLAKYRTLAKQAIDGAQQAQNAETRALALLVLDELNLHAQWTINFVAQVAASSSLNDFKTRIAALGALPLRTATQLKNAIKAKIDNGDAD